MAEKTLKAHFETENTPSKWNDLWADNFSPWDRGAPSPALIDLLAAGTDPDGKALFSASPEGRRKRALVPGCGRGYEVLLLAAAGYDAVGLDASSVAIKAAKELAEQEGSTYPLGKDIQERGRIEFVEEDFYDDKWIKKVFKDGDDKFDLIYDYTVCLMILYTYG
jgi:SAM-dependent methyltransferase